jgi:CO dehydrogenase maturation factor
VLVDLEAGVEHLGRGTAAHVDGLVVVSEPSMRSLQTGAEVGRLAADLGLSNQVLVLNRHAGGEPPELDGLPGRWMAVPPLAGLTGRQMTDASVLGLPESGELDRLVRALLDRLALDDGGEPA